MNVERFFEEIENANRVRPHAHILKEPASLASIEKWERDHGFRLPDDLASLFKISNGIGCHQEWERNQPIFHQGAFRLFSLEELVPAAEAMYGVSGTEEPSMAGWLAIGIGPDSKIFFAFDTTQRQYLMVEPIVPDEVRYVGSKIDPILQFINPANPDWCL